MTELIELPPSEPTKTEKGKRAALWKPGQSGNPKGRTPGAEITRQMIEKDRDLYLAKARELALAGDATMLRTILGILAPPQRPEGPRVSIPGLAQALTLTSKAAVIVDAMGTGLIAPDVAAQLVRVLSDFAHVNEVDELRREIDALKAQRTLRAV